MLGTRQERSGSESFVLRLAREGCGFTVDMELNAVLSEVRARFNREKFSGVSGGPQSHSKGNSRTPFHWHTPPTDDMVCLSQGVIQTSTVLGGTVSYFIVFRG